MATQSVPQVVPFPKPTEAIPQTKLEEIISLRRSIRELETRLDTTEQDVQASLRPEQSRKRVYSGPPSRFPKDVPSHGSRLWNVS